MKELVVISGKGETGKTSLAASFTVLLGGAGARPGSVGTARLQRSAADVLPPRLKISLTLFPAFC
jgi:anion-transporting  ArsA/GET3 family ATPase